MKEIFHILNRGVDKRQIFVEERDYIRFIHDLYEFNDKAPADLNSYLFRKYSDVGRQNIKGYQNQKRKPRKLLVEIYAFCLMPNHYHLLLKPRIENSVSLFMKKLDGGYAKYFNAKYERKGTLFEAKYKSIRVEEESHFVHLPYYIHFNPLDLKFPEWRERRLRNSRRAIEFLESYRWSSHLDYLGKRNFPSVTQREFLLEFFGDIKGYRNKLHSWLEEIDMQEVKGYTLE